MARVSAAMKRKLCEPYSDDENTRQFVEWSLDNTVRKVPENAFPYLSKHIPGRAFSDGDLISWYLTVSAGLQEKIPLAFNGDTGLGKSRAVVYFAHKTGTPLQMKMASPSMDLDDLLIKPIQEQSTGRCVQFPGPLTLACIYQGIAFIDEAAVMDPDRFTELNTVIQGMPHSIDGTAYGQVNLDWTKMQSIIAGNFHYKNPELDGASRYRFVWLEFQAPDAETAEAIMFNARKRRRGEKVVLKGLDEQQPNEYHVAKTTEDFELAMNSFLVELHHTLRGYALLNRSIAATGRAPKKGFLRGLLRSDAHEGVPDEAFIADAKKYLNGKPWGGASPMSMANSDYAGLLFHPQMEVLDYKRVLTDVYVNPAFAVQKPELNDAAAGYRHGLLAIIDNKLRNYFELLKEKSN